MCRRWNKSIGILWIITLLICLTLVLILVMIYHSTCSVLWRRKPVHSCIFTNKTTATKQSFLISCKSSLCKSVVDDSIGKRKSRIDLEKVSWVECRSHRNCSFAWDALLWEERLCGCNSSYRESDASKCPNRVKTVALWMLFKKWRYDSISHASSFDRINCLIQTTYDFLAFAV